MVQRTERLQRGDRHVAVAEIAGEAENVQAALSWAIERGDVEGIDRALASCFAYHEAHGSYAQGAELCSNIVALTDQFAAEDAAPTARLRARELIRRGALRTYLGAHAAAVDDLERGLAAAREQQLVHDMACAQLTLGIVERLRGDLASADRHCQAVLDIAKATGDELLAAQALQGLAFSATFSGNYGEGKRLAQQSFMAAAVERVDFRAHALDLVALAAVWGGDYQLAETTWTESLALFESIGDRSGIATAAGGVGWAARCAGGRLGEASAYSQRALAIARELGQRSKITHYLGDLALVELERGNAAQAEAYVQEGLATARALNSAIYLNYHLCILSQVASQRQQFDVARRSLSEALGIVLERRLWTNVSRVVFQVAVLLIYEAAAGGNDEAKPARWVRALELLTAVGCRPATWHEYKVHAARLSEQLRRELPQTLGDAVLDDLNHE